MAMQSWEVLEIGWINPHGLTGSARDAEGWEGGDCCVSDGDLCILVTTVLDKPWLLAFDVGEKRILWELPSSCPAQVLGSQLTIVGSRAYDASFYSQDVFTFNTSTTVLQDYTFICATEYTITLQANSSVGLGNKLEEKRKTAAKEPLAPEIQSYVSEITGLTARIQFTHNRTECTAVSSYEVIVLLTSGRSLSHSEREGLCQNKHLLPFQVKHPFNDYISLRIPAANVSGTMTLTIGDDQTIGNFQNRRLELDKEYTVTLRVVSAWIPEVRSVCAYYEPFYVSRGILLPRVSRGILLPTVSSGKVAKTVSVLLFISLLLVLVVFLVYRAGTLEVQCRHGDRTDSVLGSLHMESVSSTILTLLVTSTILQLGSLLPGSDADDYTDLDQGGGHDGWYGQRSCRDICRSGSVPVSISGLSCHRGQWIKNGKNVQTQDIKCQELPPFIVVNVSTSADSITLWGRFDNCPNSRAAELNVWLECDWSESHNWRCKRGTTVTSQRHPYCRSTLHNWTCQNLRPFSRYNIMLFVNYSLPSSGYSGYGPSSMDTRGQGRMLTFRKVLNTSLVNTSQAVLDKPRLLAFDVGEKRILWELPSSCPAQVLGSQLTIVGSRAYDASFYSQDVFTFNTSTTVLQDYTFICATEYTITLQANSSVGLGNKLEEKRKTTAKEPLAPEIQSYVSEITGLTARIQFTHNRTECTAVSSYEVIVSLTSGRSLSPSEREGLCQNKHLLPFQENHPLDDYISLHIPAANVSGTMTLTIGDDQTIGNFWNRRLELDKEYIVMLRVVSAWIPEVRSVCAYYKPFYGEFKP
ncbi:uncharacterized protein [Hemitrygon akajei]|uniref:uncharacterized protein n=1 Tax=Hemitrygon akajei TaxID=2704970 RepID=UPI003BF9A45A